MGEALFFDAKRAGCAECHAIGARGTSTIGPNLAGVALTYNRAELIRSVLEPSSRIAPGYQTSVVATRDGKVITGLIRAESDHELVLASSDAKTTHIAKPEIIERRSSNVSIMPPAPIETFSPQEFADLIGYLASMKELPRTARLPADRANSRMDRSARPGR
jgi:putative heme-binding domain-containing protein